jgi:hypothetical protein
MGDLFMNKQQYQLEKWKKIKSKGMLSYIIKRGTVFYGIAFFIIWVFIAPFVDYSYTFTFVHNDRFITKVIVFAILSPLFGSLMGYVGWRGLEKKYRNQLQT